MTTFTIHTPDSAPADSKALLKDVQVRYGQIPNVYGVLAEAPIAVEAYDTLAGLLMRSSFTPTERHVVWFTLNAYHGCHYCMAAHTFLAKGENVADEVIETARAVGRYDDPKLEALRNFTLTLAENRGWVSPDALDAFLAADFSQQNVLEIVVAIAHKVVSNYTNHIVETPVDDAFAQFTWGKPVAKAA